MKSWRESANQRRDARHTKSPDEVGKRPAAKKDTKKWCRGKVGVEHKPKCVDYRETKNNYAGMGPGFSKGWKLLVCEACGKELDHYYPFGKAKKNPPDWVK